MSKESKRNFFGPLRRRFTVRSICGRGCTHICTDHPHGGTLERQPILITDDPVYQLLEARYGLLLCTGIYRSRQHPTSRTPDQGKIGNTNFYSKRLHVSVYFYI